MWTSGTRGRTLGILWAVYGVICFIEVAWIAINSGALTVMWGALLNRVPNPYSMMTLFHMALILGVALLVLAGVFSLMAAGALLTRSRSQRNTALVAGFLGLVTGPLGLVLGVYTIVVLLPRAAEESYGRLATAA
jgi:hypothetical protein